MKTVWLSGPFSVRNPSSPTRTNLKLQQIPGTVVCNMACRWRGSSSSPLNAVGGLHLPSDIVNLPETYRWTRGMAFIGFQGQRREIESFNLCGRPLTRGGSSSSLSAFTTAETSLRSPFKLHDFRLDPVRSSLKAQTSPRTSSGNARNDPKINWTSRGGDSPRARPLAGKELVRAAGRSVLRRRPSHRWTRVALKTSALSLANGGDTG